MKKLFCILAVLSFAFSLSATKINTSQDSHGVKIITNNSSELELNYNINSLDLQTASTAQGDFTNVDFQRGFRSQSAGELALPAFHDLIEIPDGATPQIEILDYTEKELDLKSLGFPSALLSSQKTNSALDANSKNEIASINISGSIRGTAVGRLTVNPLKYNQTTHRLMVLNNLRIKVRFVGKTGNDAAKTAEYSPFFDSELNSLLNYRPLNNIAKADIIKSPATYLIVANSNLQNNAKLDEFIRLKTEKGFKVVTRFAAATETVYSIDAWIEQQYTEITPKPSFVLVIGDHDGTYGVKSEVNPTIGSIASVSRSDLIYGVVGPVSATNHLPSMHVGRFSIRSFDELTAQIDKTIWYEKTQFIANTDLNYLKTALVQGSNAIENYCLSYYFNDTYINPATGTTNGMIGVGINTANQTANVPALLSNGTPWAHFYTNGNENMFGVMNIAAINNLTNSNKYGLYIANSILSANFGETESIGEACMNAANKGSIGFIGSSMIQPWVEDEVMGLGEVSNLNMPPFTPSSLGMADGVMLRKYSTQASIKYCGLLAVENYGGNTVSAYWSGYQLLGDPSVLIYMGVPQILPITHQPTVIPGSPTFTVTTVKNAYVALSDEDGILHGAAMTDENGLAVLNIIPFTSENAKLVVYAPMYKPLFKTLPVAPGPNGPQPMVTNYSVHNNNYGQNCFIDLELFNYGSAASNGLTVSATVDPADSVYAKVISQPVSYGNLAVADSMLVDSAIIVALSANVPDQRLIKINLTLTDSYTKRVYQQNINITANAPKLEFSVNAGETIMPGDTRNLIYKIKNRGHLGITQLDINLLQTTALPIVIYDPHQTANVLNVSDSLVFSFPVQFAPSIPMGWNASFTLNLTAINNFSKTYTHNLKIGAKQLVFSENFEGEWPPSAWQNNGWTQKLTGGVNNGRCASAFYQLPNIKTITTKAIDISWIDSATLSFWWKDNDITKVTGHDTTFCEVSVNDTTWTTIGILSASEHESDYHQFVYNIPNQFKNQNFKIRWLDKTDGGYSAWGTGIDDILIEGFIIVNIDDSVIPQSTTLFQNYPNPFNPETTIRFFNQETAPVKLAIFNLKGEMVADLVNSRLDQGFHDYKFNPTGLASGVYIYKLQIGNQSMVKSMLLLK